MHNPGLGECHPWLNPLHGIAYDSSGNFSNTAAIDWVIIGGESGSKARPFHLEWAQFLIHQCNEAGVKVFMKQVGSNAFYEGKPFKTKSRSGSDPSEWPKWARAQEFPATK
jgi:protein gp37